MGLITYLYRGYNPVTKYHGHPSIRHFVNRFFSGGELAVIFREADSLIYLQSEQLGPTKTEVFPESFGNYLVGGFHH